MLDTTQIFKSGKRHQYLVDRIQHRTLFKKLIFSRLSVVQEFNLIFFIFEKPLGKYF